MRDINAVRARLAGDRAAQAILWQYRHPGSWHTEAGKGDGGIELGTTDGDIETDRAFEALVSRRGKSDHRFTEGDDATRICRRTHRGHQFSSSHASKSFKS